MPNTNPTADVVADLRRELTKAEDALSSCLLHLSRHAQANAALHCSERVMYSPLHAKVEAAISGIVHALKRTEMSPEAAVPPPVGRAVVRAEAFDEAAEKLASLDPDKALLAGESAWKTAAGIVRHMATQERRMAAEAQTGAAFMNTADQAAALGLTPTEYRAHCHRQAVKTIQAAVQGLYAGVGINVMAALDETQPTTSGEAR